MCVASPHQRPLYARELFRRGFTLVELLVVIGIIALLISILLPALSRAREGGNKVACLSNLKQLGNAMSMYCSDNKGYFPRSAASGQSADDWIFWDGRDVNDGPLVKYLGNTFVANHYRCPSDDAAASRAPFAYSYSMNEFMGGLIPPASGADLHKRIKITQVIRHTEKILLLDEASTTIDDGCWAPQRYDPAAGAASRNLLSNRHDKSSENKNDPNAGKGNVLFVDFHADFIDRKLSTDPMYYDYAK